MPRKSTASEAASKPQKPFPDFPLFPHPFGKWCKKVKGRLVYFTHWEQDPRGDDALRIWNAEKDEIYETGRRARTRGDGPTVADAINGFLLAKELAVETGEISARHFCDLKTSGKRTAQVLGRDRLLSELRPDDFRKLKLAIAKTRKSLATLANEITLARAPFLWAYKNDLIDKPIKFGTEFVRPPKGKLRAERNKSRGNGWTFEPSEIHALITAAGVHIKAMIHLAIQAGFGPSDVCNLPLSAVDLSRGWIDFPRPKTGISRRVPLWPETVQALRASLDERPAPKTAAAHDAFFVTKYGDTWGDGITRFPVTGEFSKLVKQVGVERSGRGIYGLRHSFRTVAGRSRDVEAIRAIMGHTSEHVEETYIHGVEDERLRAVVDHVRAWLFPAKPEQHAIGETAGKDGAE